MTFILLLAELLALPQEQARSGGGQPAACCRRPPAAGRGSGLHHPLWLDATFYFSMHSKHVCATSCPTLRAAGKAAGWPVGLRTR
jgi:hypothetical protein